MTDFLLAEGLARLADMTPAGIQPARVLLHRRLLFAAAVMATCVGMGIGVFVMLGCDRDDATLAKFAIFVLSLPVLPWFATGFWNAVLGFWLLRKGANGLRQAAPFMPATNDASPLSSRIAIIMTIRNEDPVRAFARLKAVRDDLEAFKAADVFDYFFLSDTSEPNIGAAEQSLCESWPKSESSAGKLIYRRRSENTGFKAGNISEFLDRWGEHYDFLLPLDADSVMSAEAIAGLVRIMQAHPKIGILQSLVVGAPSSSAFARIFQFGMRHAMRSYTMGSAWWTGDCGPYWGHNALIRVEPLHAECNLSHLSGTASSDRPILSHDQIEAVLMRRAGYEVRVIPVEGGSYEDNPPTLLDFVQRDARWGQGNLQYWRFLGLPQLKALSRIQLALAILMYLGWVALAAAVAIAVVCAVSGNFTNIDNSAAWVVLLTILSMSLAPKLAGFASIITSKGGTARYGGGVRLLAGAAIELFFNWFVSVITSFRTTLFMASGILGTPLQWSGQLRDARRLYWTAAAFAFWPETLCGLFLSTSFLAGAPLAWALPILVPLALSVPFAVLTSSPVVGRLFVAAKLCAVPEEFEQVAILDRLQPPRETSLNRIATLGSPGDAEVAFAGKLLEL